jgi:hypothetical protein
MKRFALLLFAAVLSFNALAQEEKTSEEKKDDEKKEGGFRKDKLFTGGNLNIGYFNGVTVLGATPQLGYSVASWLDAGIVFGYTYTSQGDIYGNKIRNTIIGPGAFVRLFPVEFIFASVQYEHNFLRQKQIYPGQTYIFKDDVNSLLVGLGYTSGKDGGNSPYYYFSVSVDVFNNPNSPYKTYNGEIYPVVNAGFNIPLFQGSGRNR